MLVICRPHLNSPHWELQWESEGGQAPTGPSNPYSSWVAFMYNFSFNNGMLFLKKKFHNHLLQQRNQVAYYDMQDFQWTGPWLPLQFYLLPSSAFPLLYSNGDLFCSLKKHQSSHLVAVAHIVFSGWNIILPPSPTRWAAYYLRKCNKTHIQFIKVKVK